MATRLVPFLMSSKVAFQARRVVLRVSSLGPLWSYRQGLREVEDLHACNSGADKRDHPPQAPKRPAPKSCGLALASSWMNSVALGSSSRTSTVTPRHPSSALRPPPGIRLRPSAGQTQQRCARPGLQQGPQQCCRAVISLMLTRRSTSGARCPSPSGTSKCSVISCTFVRRSSPLPKATRTQELTCHPCSQTRKLQAGDIAKRLIHSELLDLRSCLLQPLGLRQWAQPKGCSSPRGFTDSPPDPLQTS